MSSGSPYSLFSTWCYRARYLLLPFANGALLIAGYAFAHGYLGVPEGFQAEPSGFIPYLAGFLWRLMEFLAFVMVIYWIDLLVRSAVCRKNFFRPWRRTLGLVRVQPDMQSLIANVALTFAGYYAALFALEALSLWPDTEETMTLFIAFVLGMMTREA